MKNNAYTAEQYRKFITELLEGVSDVRFLRQIYSLIVLHQRKRTGD